MHYVRDVHEMQGGQFFFMAVHLGICIFYRSSMEPRGLQFILSPLLVYICTDYEYEKCWELRFAFLILT